MPPTNQPPKTEPAVAPVKAPSQTVRWKASLCWRKRRSAGVSVCSSAVISVRVPWFRAASGRSAVPSNAVGVWAQPIIPASTCRRSD